MALIPTYSMINKRSDTDTPMKMPEIVVSRGLLLVEFLMERAYHKTCKISNMNLPALRN